MKTKTLFILMLSISILTWAAQKPTDTGENLKTMVQSLGMSKATNVQAATQIEHNFNFELRALEQLPVAVVYAQDEVKVSSNAGKFAKTITAENANVKFRRARDGVPTILNFHKN